MGLLLSCCRARKHYERPRDRNQRRFAERMERLKWERQQDGFLPESLASECWYEDIYQPPCAASVSKGTSPGLRALQASMCFSATPMRCVNHNILLAAPTGKGLVL